jgi:hypothetical protein
VQAVGADSLVHIARTDQRGVFALRYLPAGEVVVTAFLDQDRDRRLGERESRGTVLTSLAVGDTAVIEIPVLAPDTTAAVVGAATALDSVTVVVELDDFLDGDAPAADIDIELVRDGGGAPQVERLFHEREYEQYVDEMGDSLAGLAPLDTAAAADTTGILGPTQGIAPPRLTGATGSQNAPAGRARPARRLVGRLNGPLEPEIEYRVVVGGVVNINGLSGGGGEVRLVYVPPPPAPPDSADVAVPDADDPDAVAPDSTAAPDSLGIRP